MTILRRVDAMVLHDPAAFILANTRLQTVPHAPEISLWLADEITPIWKMTEEELGALGLPPPFWAFAWAGGQAIARWLLDNPEEVRGRTVLDFATGSGLVGIAALKAGAASVTGCDIDPFCAAAVAVNARANGVTMGFTGENLLDSPPPAVDLICAGDVCYEKPMTERVLDWLASARAQGTRVLLGDPGRTYLPKSGLTFLAEYRVQTTRELEDYEIKRTCVWSL
ncbi:class I SAM-dependent methyltransferase [Brevundimonas variabilis]|uniref:Putative nicotinamide N-methyase n=1 Tax=Brevundimonas variabilis TaxID=74312 RepID=A0A7W9CGQ9_9CAUL|nr:methyltransferase [Brevundimonas variabilis]MBB5744872.1 putative nicotinamide N-methyase [Brevundimonas variabilis]